MIIAWWNIYHYLEPMFWLLVWLVRLNWFHFGWAKGGPSLETSWQAVFKISLSLPSSKSWINDVSQMLPGPKIALSWIATATLSTSDEWEDDDVMRTASKMHELALGGVGWCRNRHPLPVTSIVSAVLIKTHYCRKYTPGEVTMPHVIFHHVGD